MEGRLVSLDFSAAFDIVSHRGLLYKLRFISVRGQFLSIVLEFLSDRRQRVRLDDKVTASVDVVSGVPQGTLLGLFFINVHSFHFLGTILWAMRMIVRSMPSVLDHCRVPK